MSESRAIRVGSSMYAGCVGLIVLLASGCHGESGHHGASARQIGPAVIAIEIPAEYGEPERAPVEFDHDEHTKALGGTTSCTSCHVEEEGLVRARIKGAEQITDLDSLMEVYHDQCLSCHEQRSAEGLETGPQACGECHLWQEPAISERAPMRWDLSLHQRHVIAEGDQCESCHHVYNEKTHRLEHRTETEGACSDCHGEHDRVVRIGEREVKLSSLRKASHAACVNCHRERAEKQRKSLPQDCEGCHSAEAQQTIERLENPPRLKRGQPGFGWLTTEGATSNLVPFNHLGHEGVVNRCSTCHHNTLHKCGDCHTVNGRPEGHGVTLEQAYHNPSSEHSCVGCHQQIALQNTKCAGCHAAFEEPPGELACRRCHNGPRRSMAKLVTPNLPSNILEPPQLPMESEDFPTTVTIDSLADHYGPSKLPHREIVKTLTDGLVRSKLGMHFHNNEPAPCAGCHHRSPEGTRPPACSSCHTNTAASDRDRPSLTAAYHRQCIGCHQQMGLVTGCTDCHRKATNRQRSGQ